MFGAALLVLLGGCSGSAVTEADCRRAFIATCNHQVACELAYDFQSCDTELQAQFICDFDRSNEEFEACSDAAPLCTESMARECFVVLCDKTLGCIDATAGDTSDEQAL